MTTFDDRTGGFEGKFAHDEELRFRALHRRNKLLCQWAARRMGMSDGEVDSYAQALVMADFEHKTEADVIDQVYRDLTAKNLGISRHRVQRQMEHSYDVARQQIMTE